MFAQLMHNSMAILRQPTKTRFQHVVAANWQLGFVYIAMGEVVATLLNILTRSLQAQAREQQIIDITRQYGQIALVRWLEYAQTPMFTAALGVIGFCSILLLWVLLPYWMGRALGGSKSFGNFAYGNSLFIAPLNIVDGLLGLALGALAPGLYWILFLSLAAFRFYLVGVNLQASMGLPTGKSAVAVLIPAALVVILLCGLLIVFATAGFSQ